MMRLLKTLFFCWLVVTMVLAFFQRELLYQPRTARRLPVTQLRQVMRLYPASIDVQLKCRDGVTIRGWLLRQEVSRPAEAARRPLVIYFHGNAGNRADRTGWYELMSGLDVDVLAIDYHGYGDSEGSMSEKGLEADCEAAWKYAINEAGYRPQNIIVAGTSLGGAAAVYLASDACQRQQPPAALVTVAAFSSMVDVAAYHYPWLPVRLVLVDRYPSDQRITRVTCRYVHMHGTADTIVPEKFGRRLFAAAPDKSADGVSKQWISLANVGHNNLVSGAGPEIFAAMKKVVSDLPR